MRNCRQKTNQKHGFVRKTEPKPIEVWVGRIVYSTNGDLTAAHMTTVAVTEQHTVVSQLLKHSLWTCTPACHLSPMVLVTNVLLGFFHPLSQTTVKPYEYENFEKYIDQLEQKKSNLTTPAYGVSSLVNDFWTAISCTTVTKLHV